MTALAERNRPMAIVIGLLIAFQATAVLVLAAAFGFEFAALGSLGALLDRGPEAVELLRWGALLDLAGYFAFGAVVAYVSVRLRRLHELAAAILLAAGISAIAVGAVGATLLAVVGPALMTDLPMDPATSASARLALDMLGETVAAGLWGTLELALLGGWFVGVGWQLRAERIFGGLATLTGVGMIASSVRTGITGRTLPEIAGPLDALFVLAVVAALVLLILWLVWLAAALWTSESPTGSTVRP